MKEKKEEDKSSKFLQVSAHPPYEQKKMKTNNHFQPMDIKTQPQFNHYSLGHKLMHHIMNWNTTVTPVRKNSFMQWLVHVVEKIRWEGKFTLSWRSVSWVNSVMRQFLPNGLFPIKFPLPSPVAPVSQLMHQRYDPKRAMEERSEDRFSRDDWKKAIS